MKLLREFVGVACLCALVSVSPAQAATYSVMTFTGIPECCSASLDADSTNELVEDGITAVAGGPDNDGFGYWDPLLTDTAHLSDGHSTYPTFITFTMLGRFDAIGFDLIPSYKWADEPFCTFDDDPMCFGEANNVLLTGVRDGSVVAEHTFFMGTLGTSLIPYLFSNAFTDLDSLVIAAILPDWAEHQAPTTGFNIDNVTLALVTPVPIPAPLLLFLTGIAGLGIIGRRARRRSLRTATTRG